MKRLIRLNSGWFVANALFAARQFILTTTKGGMMKRIILVGAVLFSLSVTFFSLYQLWDLMTWETSINGKVQRKVFAQSVMMKKTNEVIQLYGKPDRTLPINDVTSHWQYERKTYDPISGKVDSVVTVEVVGDTAFGTGF